MSAWDYPRGLCFGFFPPLFPSKGNDERKEMERKQEYNLQSKFHSGVMTLVGGDVMGKGLEPISGAWRPTRSSIRQQELLSTRKQYDLGVSGGN